MSLFEAFILGMLQGLTEFLPVSSSGHIQLGAYFFGISTSENLMFTVIVHGGHSSQHYNRFLERNTEDNPGYFQI